MQARYYEPETGRFTQTDPMTYDLMQLANGQNNRWTYCGNDPVNLSDPTGCFILLLAVVIGVIFLFAMLFKILAYLNKGNARTCTDPEIAGDYEALSDEQSLIGDILGVVAIILGLLAIPAVAAIVGKILGYVMRAFAVFLFRTLETIFEIIIGCNPTIPPRKEIDLMGNRSMYACMGRSMTVETS